MATSGSTNYIVTRNDIITEALELLGVKDLGEAIDANHVTSCARSLEMMIKHWQVNGISLWKTKDLYVFLVKDQQYYDLGPSGDHATISKVKTEVSTAAASGASTVLVDSITGITSGDNIGIELDGGDLQWTTVNGAPSGSTITLTAALTDDVSVDANVFTYTTITSRPLYISEMGNRIYDDSSAAELPLKLVAGSRYKAITDKTTTGAANTIYYDPQMTDGRLFVWPVADNVKDYLILTAKMPVEDFDAAANNPDFPQEWYFALSWNLAAFVAPKFLHKSWDAVNLLKARELLDEVSAADKDYGSVYFEFEA